MRRSASLALTAAALVAALAGCGGSSNDDTATTSAQATGAFPKAGIAFTPPADWNVDAGSGHLVATAQAGQATVAVWRYPRTETLPKSRLQLQSARDALLEASTKRDATFEKIKTAATEIAGEPAVQIRAREHVAGQPRTVRSTHIYAHGAEYVIDAYADADSFRAVDAQVFRPLLRSVHVSAPQ
ncbi:hypothetical protein DSM104299_03074 [Baekduia alba]|uniref:hypothetical protein n=1 Tax=Baekduia alba TaxID=2997333 RepID=UPI0023412998|nr:hypothetical protein [Baekduia alba]WCB94340.1 hypothetical protein DSM104299_03074 [Baekduia alba]